MQNKNAYCCKWGKIFMKRGVVSISIEERTGKEKQKDLDVLKKWKDRKKVKKKDRQMVLYVDK